MHRTTVGADIPVLDRGRTVAPPQPGRMVAEARIGLESAMAAAITSRSHQRRLVEDPEAYARSFHLGPVEVESVCVMAADLNSLTGSFVSKRCQTLSGHARRTIALLGRQGHELVEEFVDTHVMTESLRTEASRFGAYMIERTQAMDDGTARTGIIADMARFERHRSDAFWEATDRASSSPRPSSTDGSGGLSTGGRIRLRRGTSVGSFRWDVRIPYRLRIEPLHLLQSDPCTLLFFHNGGPAGQRTLRLTSREADVHRILAGRKSLPWSTMVARLGDNQDAEQLLCGFVREGVIEWV
jgi:hypothetical protein